MYCRSRATKNRCSQKSLMFQNEIINEPQFYEPHLLPVKISASCTLSIKFYAGSKFYVINTIASLKASSNEKTLLQKHFVSMLYKAVLLGRANKQFLFCFRGANAMSSINIAWTESDFCNFNHF